jgi:hypothetical protein
VLAHGHMPHGIGLRLSARGSSGAAMRFVAPAPAPSFSRFRCRHVSRGVNSRVSAWSSSGVATCPVVPAPTSRLGAARVPPCIRGTSSRLPARGSSGAATDPRYSADHGLSKYTNIPPWNYYCNILSGCSHIFQNATRQDWRHTPARHAAGGAFSASKTCGQGVARLQQCGADLLPTHGGSLQCRVARQLCAAEPPQCRVTQ